jgi:hypothetical protein
MGRSGSMQIIRLAVVVVGVFGSFAVVISGSILNFPAQAQSEKSTKGQVSDGQKAQKSRGQCTKECGGVAGGCAANTIEAQICFNRCMGTNECPVGKAKK